jgi:type III secretion protein R
MSTLENGILVALVALLPLVVLMLTSFVKVSVVLALLRNALGTPDAPSGLVVTGLSLVLTFFVMAPVAAKMVQAAASSPGPTAPAPKQGPAPGGAAVPGGAAGPTAAAVPAGTPVPQTGATAPTGATATGGAVAPTGVAATGPAPTGTAATGTAAPTSAAVPPSGDTTIDAALRVLVPAQYQPQLAAGQRALEPLREFLIRHTRGTDRETFAILATQLGNTVVGDELYVMAPAFIATELREAFAIAILIFVPFLVLDLVVALGLAALGLQTTSPQTVALPLKLVLFVAVDGWRLLLDGLLRGYV